MVKKNLLILNSCKHFLIYIHWIYWTFKKKKKFPLKFFNVCCYFKRGWTFEGLLVLLKRNSNYCCYVRPDHWLKLFLQIYPHRTYIVKHLLTTQQTELFKSKLSNSPLSYLHSLQSASQSKQLWVKVEESGCDKCSEALLWDQREEFTSDLRRFLQGEWHRQGLSLLRFIPTVTQEIGC